MRECILGNTRKKITTLEELAVIIEDWFRKMHKHFDRLDAIFHKLEIGEENIRKEDLSSQKK